jgi:LacI family transcriptional regulator, galactose operon repressor
MEKQLADGKNISLKDVAEAAACSQVTVSRVFSGQIKVADKTRIKVMKAAEALGYTPNLLAKSLRNGKSNMIALVFNLMGPHDPAEVPQTISKSFWDNEKKIYFISNRVIEVFNEQLLNYQQMRFEGIILEWSSRMNASQIDILKKFKAAVLITPQKYDIALDQIIWDRTQSIRDTVDYLVKSGRCSPAFIIEPNSNATKLGAFKEQLAKYNINPENRCIALEEDKLYITAQHHYEALKKYYPDGKHPYDAFLCSNDEIAKMAIYWLNEHGYKVPDDVAVIGFNNSQTAAFNMPPLASVDRRHSEMSKIAYDLLSSRMKNPALAPRCIDLPMRFIRRESAG